MPTAPPSTPDASPASASAGSVKVRARGAISNMAADKVSTNKPMPRRRPDSPTTVCSQ